MEQSRWEADCRWSSHIPLLCRIRRVFFTKFTAVSTEFLHTVTSSHPYFKILLHVHPLPRRLFPLRFPTRLHAVLLSRVCKVLTPSHSWYDHQNSIWCTLQIMTRCCAVLWTFCTPFFRHGFVTFHLLQGLGLLGICDWPSIKSCRYHLKVVFSFQLVQQSYVLVSFKTIKCVRIIVRQRDASGCSCATWESTDFGMIITPAANT